MMKYCEIEVDDLWVVAHVHVVRKFAPKANIRCRGCHGDVDIYPKKLDSKEKIHFYHKAENPACKYDDNPLILSLTN